MNIHNNGMCELLLGIRRKIRENSPKKTIRDDLTFSQFETLWFIGLKGRKNMETIAEHLKITPPSATYMINKMVKRGLVSRIHDIKDKRIVYISLTQKTKKNLEIIRKHKEEMFIHFISKLSSVDKQNLQRIIKILITE
jgi:DNA-binding MarR family transcriptional regulator